jgi:hypothetical protein
VARELSLVQVMEGCRSWSVESKVFEVLIRGGGLGVRIYESSKRKKSSIFVRRDEITWLVGALEEVAEEDKSAVGFVKSRASTDYYTEVREQARTLSNGRGV